MAMGNPMKRLAPLVVVMIGMRLSMVHGLKINCEL